LRILQGLATARGALLEQFIFARLLEGLVLPFRQHTPFLSFRAGRPKDRPQREPRLRK
jgi:hypothetical protein